MSELKFKLTKESKINAWGGKLFRIEAIVNFKNGNNEIKKGTKGGWVEKESNLSGNAWVSGDARVCGNAWVSGDAMVCGNATVSGNARVYGDAMVCGNAWVYGDAMVCGNAWVSGNAMVCGNATVSGNATVYGDARVYGDASLIAKLAYTKGRFVGGDNSETPKFTNITDKTGSNYWRNQYVIGDYEISEIEPKAVETSETEPEIITLNGKRYKVVE